MLVAVSSETPPSNRAKTEMAGRVSTAERQGGAGRRFRLFTLVGTWVAALIGLGGLILAIQTSESRELEVRFTAALSILNDRPESVDSSLTVTLSGDLVHNPRTIAGYLKNVGSAPIRAADIEAPVSMHLRGSRMLTAHVTRTVPPDLPAQINVRGDSVSVAHGLLNPGDTIEFEILADGPDGWPAVSGRIAGIAEVAVFRPEDQANYTVGMIDLPAWCTVVLVAIESVLALVLFAGAVFLSKDLVEDLRTPEEWEYSVERLASECMVTEISEALKKKAGQLDSLIERGLSPVSFRWAPSTELVDRRWFDPTATENFHLPEFLADPIPIDERLRGRVAAVLQEQAKLHGATPNPQPNPPLHDLASVEAYFEEVGLRIREEAKRRRFSVYIGWEVVVAALLAATSAGAIGLLALGNWAWILA